MKNTYLIMVVFVGSLSFVSLQYSAEDLKDLLNDLDDEIIPTPPPAKPKPVIPTNPKPIIPRGNPQKVSPSQLPPSTPKLVLTPRETIEASEWKKAVTSYTNAVIAKGKAATVQAIDNALDKYAPKAIDYATTAAQNQLKKSLNSSNSNERRAAKILEWSLENGDKSMKDNATDLLKLVTKDPNESWMVFKYATGL